MVLRLSWMSFGRWEALLRGPRRDFTTEARRAVKVNGFPIDDVRFTTAGETSCCKADRLSALRSDVVKAKGLRYMRTLMPMSWRSAGVHPLMCTRDFIRP